MTSALAQTTTGGAETLEDLDASILQSLPADIRSQIEDGAIDRLPQDVVESLPASVQDRIPDGLVAAAGDNALLTLVLLAAGILGALGFLYGVTKSAFKAAAFFAVVSAGAWYWLVVR